MAITNLSEMAKNQLMLTAVGALCSCHCYMCYMTQGCSKHHKCFKLDVKMSIVLISDPVQLFGLSFTHTKPSIILKCIKSNM